METDSKPKSSGVMLLMNGTYEGGSISLQPDNIVMELEGCL